MKRYQVAAILLEIEQLVYVWHIGAGNHSWASAISIVRSNMPLRRPIEHRFGHHSFANQHDANRATVIMYRSPLTLLPAQQQHLGILAPDDQIPGVLVISKESIGLVVPLPDQKRGEPIDDLG